MLAAAFAAAETAGFDCVPISHRQSTADLLAQRLASGQLRTIEAKEHIFREGDPVTHVCLVEVGHVCIYRTLCDGRRQVIDFAYPGDLIGLGAIDEHANSAQATARTRVRCVPVSALRQAVREDGRLGLKLY